MHIDSCYGADEDFDGQSYRLDWPDTNPDVAKDRALHPQPVLFTSPATNGKNCSVIEFENDMPTIEAKGAQFSPPFCNQVAGAHCVNPPHGAQFYPFFSTTKRNGTCTWQEGGKFLPGTIRDFGGSSTAGFGSLLKVLFPVKGSRR